MSHDDETQPAPLMRLPDSGLIFQPIRFTHEEEQWLKTMEELNRLLIESLRVMPDMLGETYNR